LVLPLQNKTNSKNGAPLASNDSAILFSIALNLQYRTP
jgi:hypothetical protein